MKLFTRKPKQGKPAREEDSQKPVIPTPLYQKLATRPQPSTDESREVCQPPPDAPQIPNPHIPQQLINPPSLASFRENNPRSVSPLSNISPPTPNKLIRHHDRDREPHVLRKKSQTTAPVAVGILRALDPPRPPADSHSVPASQSEERFSAYEQPYAGRESIEKKERRGFWGTRDKDKDKDRPKDRDLHPTQQQQQHVPRERERERDTVYDRDRERGRETRRDDDPHDELTRMIGYLTATASEDWNLVLEVCDRASSNESNAKEATRALRREFKYGEPPAQLSAARLWAIMLRNSSDVFIAQSTTRKFLETLEELLSSSKTSPVVRERLLEVVAAAAFASGTSPRSERDGFKGLWKRVKPFDKPDEGVPFDNDDAMFHPSASATPRVPGFDVPVVSYQEPSPVGLDSAALTPTQPQPPVLTKKSSTRNRIIPPDEDMRRLFQECKIGQGNASLLSQALALSKPEELKRKAIIKEFVTKCRSSQELIYAQIPWATAGAERSRAIQDSEGHVRQRTQSNANDGTLGANEALLAEGGAGAGEMEMTIEEQLLAEILGANAELMEALRQFEDMERVANERKAEAISRKEVRRERKNQEQIAVDQTSSFGGGSSSRSPSPPPTRRKSRSRSPHPPNINNTHPPIVQPHPQHQHKHLYSYSQHSHSHSLSQSQAQTQSQIGHGSQLGHGLVYGHSRHPSESDMDTTLHGGAAGSTNLAPPPAAPHGPRSPAQISVHSRTPSPTPREPYAYSSSNHNYSHNYNGAGGGSAGAHGAGMNGYSIGGVGDESEEEEEEELVPVVPSAKALGKRKVVDPEPMSVGRGSFDPDDIYYDGGVVPAVGDGAENGDFEDDAEDRWHSPPQHFVYDAVAERSRLLQSTGGRAPPLINGAH